MESNRLFRQQFDSCRLILMVRVNRSLGTIEWRLDAYNGLDGERIATQELGDRRLSNWIEEMEFAFQEFLYQVEAQAEPCC